MSSGRSRFVFMYPYEPGAYEARVHGWQALRSRGFEIEAIVVPALAGSPAMQSGTRELAGAPVVTLADRASLRAYLERHASSSMFVDFLFGLGEPSYRGRHVLPAIAEAGGEYCVVSGGALPPSDQSVSVSQLKRWLTLATDPARLGDFVGRKVEGLVGALPPTPPPARVFSGHSEALDGYLARTGVPADRLTWVNSFDYDVYLAYLAAHGGVVPQPEPIAVFLDEGAVNHPDFALLGESSADLSAEAYSASVRRVFDEVERRTRLRVVVAAHPRVDYSSQPPFFGEGDVVVGETVDLVARSSAVLAHASTAVSFAALFDKPLLIFKTGMMEATSYGATVDRIARGIGVAPLAADGPAAIQGFDFDVSHWSRAGFGGYLDRYVRSAEAPRDRTTWDIVADTLLAAGAVATPKR